MKIMKTKFLLALMLLMGIAPKLMAQNISGRVIDQDNQPLEFVTVTLINLPDSSVVRGVITDEVGNFSIDGKGGKLLRFSSVGYQTTTVEISKTEVGDITLPTDAKQLAEIKIEAASIINKSDRQLYIPKEAMVAQCSDGSEFLEKLKIPEVIVDKTDGSVSLVDEGNVTLCINGRPAKKEQIRALDPKNIKRVEYHDKPSLRWGDAKAVIDFIVENPDSGGNANASVGSGLNYGTQYLYGSASVYSGKSEFSIDLYGGNQRGFESHSTSTTNYLTSNGSSYSRTSENKKAASPTQYAFPGLNYSYTDTLQLFSVNVGYFGYRNKESASEGSIFNSKTNESTVHMDTSSNSSTEVWAELYYHRKFKNDNLLIFDISGSLGKNTSNSSYLEQGNDSSSYYFNTINDVVSNTKMMEVKLNYEKSFEKGRFSIGVNQSLSTTGTEYESQSISLATTTGTTYAFAELMTNFSSDVDLTIGAALNRDFTEMEGSDQISSWSVQPRLRLHWRQSQKANFNFSLSSYTNSPSVSQLTSVSQMVDGYQTTQGNGNLKNYNTFGASIEQSYTVSRFYIKGSAYISHSVNPIMTDKYWNDNESMIISSYSNGKYINNISLSASSRIEIIRDWLSASAYVRFRNTMVEGNTYSHRTSSLSSYITTELSHYDFTLQASVNTPSKWLNNESLYEGSLRYSTSLSYKITDGLFVSISAENPFKKETKTTNKDLNQWAGSSSTSYSKSSNLYTASLRWNIHWGGFNKYQDMKRVEGHSSNTSVGGGEGE